MMFTGLKSLPKTRIKRDNTFQTQHVPSDEQLAFYTACSRGQLVHAQQLLASNASIDISAGNFEAFFRACFNEQLDVANWILTLKPELHVHATDEWIFEKACLNQHFAIARWIFPLEEDCVNNIFIKQKDPDVSELSTFAAFNARTFHSWQDCAFEEACFFGYFEVAKWLFSVKPDISLAEDAFYTVVCTGNLNFAQWLLSVKPDIDISANNEEAFAIACKNGYFEIAKWLFSVKPDINISINNERAFRGACKNNHLHIAKWLLSVKPTIDFTAKNTRSASGYTSMSFSWNGEIIETWLNSLAIRKLKWENRKYAMWMRKNTKCLFYCIPEDVSRHIIQTYL